MPDAQKNPLKSLQRVFHFSGQEDQKSSNRHTS